MPNVGDILFTVRAKIDDFRQKMGAVKSEARQTTAQLDKTSNRVGGMTAGMRRSAVSTDRLRLRIRSVGAETQKFVDAMVRAAKQSNDPFLRKQAADMLRVQRAYERGNISSNRFARLSDTIETKFTRQRSSIARVTSATKQYSITQELAEIEARELAQAQAEASKTQRGLADQVAITRGRFKGGLIDATAYRAEIVRLKGESTALAAATVPTGRELRAFNQVMAQTVPTAVSARKGLGTIRSSAFSLTSRLVGLNGTVGTLLGGISQFAVGNLAALGVIAGIAAIAAGYRKLTERAREAAKATKDALVEATRVVRVGDLTDETRTENRIGRLERQLRLVDDLADVERQLAAARERQRTAGLGAAAGIGTGGETEIDRLSRREATIRRLLGKEVTGRDAVVAALNQQRDALRRLREAESRQDRKRIANEVRDLQMAEMGRRREILNTIRALKQQKQAEVDLALAQRAQQQQAIQNFLARDKQRLLNERFDISPASAQDIFGPDQDVERAGNAIGRRIGTAVAAGVISAFRAQSRTVGESIKNILITGIEAALSGVLVDKIAGLLSAAFSGRPKSSRGRPKSSRPGLDALGLAGNVATGLAVGGPLGGLVAGVTGLVGVGKTTAPTIIQRGDVAPPVQRTQGTQAITVQLPPQRSATDIGRDREIVSMIDEANRVIAEGGG